MLLLRALPDQTANPNWRETHLEDAGLIKMEKQVEDKC